MDVLDSSVFNIRLSFIIPIPIKSHAKAMKDFRGGGRWEMYQHVRRESGPASVCLQGKTRS